MPDEAPEAYLKRVQEEGERHEVPLSFRRGGEADLGIQVEDQNIKTRAWAIFGAPHSWGPESLKSWLKDNGWEVAERPSEPRRRNSPWHLLGYNATHPGMDSYSYTLKDLNKYISIRKWQPHKKTWEGNKNSSSIGGMRWWGIEDKLDDPISVSPTQRYEPPIAPTQIDDTPDLEKMEDDANDETMEDPKKGEKRDGESGLSPDKKKLKGEKFRQKHGKHNEPSEPKLLDGSPGPDGSRLIDCEGAGDCAYRCIAYKIACFTEPNTPAHELRGKVSTLSKSLRVQVVNYLLHTNTQWQDNWVPDSWTDNAKEGGSPPTTLEEFKESLSRPGRWACGLTLQAASSLKHVNLAIFKKPTEDSEWKRIALFTPPDRKAKKNKTIGLVLNHGHYFVLEPKGKQEPTAWSESFSEQKAKEDAKISDGAELHHLSKAVRGGGGDAPCTPKKLHDPDFERLLRTCSSVGSNARLLRTCSSIKTKSSKSRRSDEKLWKCEFCDIEIEKAASYRITRHLQMAHRDEFQQALAQQKESGRSGKTARLYKPAEFIDVKDDECKFRCPFCHRGIHFEVPDGHRTRLAKVAHLKQCKKAKQNCKTLREFQNAWMRSKKTKPVFRSRFGQYKIRQIKALQKAKSRGHDPIVIPYKTGWKSKSIGNELMICKSCHYNTHSKKWHYVCKSKPSSTAAWWKRTAKHNKVDLIFDQLGINEIDKIEIKKTIAKKRKLRSAALVKKVEANRQRRESKRLAAQAILAGA